MRIDEETTDVRRRASLDPRTFARDALRALGDAWAAATAHPGSGGGIVVIALHDVARELEAGRADAVVLAELLDCLARAEPPPGVLSALALARTAVAMLSPDARPRVRS